MKEFSMLKFSKLIATVLVLVMLACSFTGCLSYVHRSDSTGKRVAFAVVDIVFLPVSLIALLIYVLINDASGETDYQTYLSSAGYDISTEYFSLMGRIRALPEEELAALKGMLDAIPESEHNAIMEKLNGLSEAEHIALVNACASLPDTEIVSAINRISALSETERDSLLRDFISLPESEIPSLIEELDALREEKNYFALAGYPREKEHAELAFQY
jgi:hypothetical protein